MQIRGYDDADRQGVISLWSQVLPNPAPHNDPETSLRKKLEADRELLLVAADGNTIAGTVMGGYDGHRGWIYSLAVLPSYRRRGVGTKLVRAVEFALSARGALKVNLQVRGSNASVVAFYQRLGYTVEDILSLGRRLYE